MLIKKGYAWAVVDEGGELIYDEVMGSYDVFPTRDEAMFYRQKDANERVVKVKIEVMGG